MYIYIYIYTSPAVQTAGRGWSAAPVEAIINHNNNNNNNNNTISNNRNTNNNNTIGINNAMNNNSNNNNNNNNSPGRRGEPAPSREQGARGLFGLRTNGVDTNGVAATNILFDRLGKAYVQLTYAYICWQILSDWYRTSTSVTKHNICVSADPLSADPICPFPRCKQRMYIHIYIYIYRERER